MQPDEIARLAGELGISVAVIVWALRKLDKYGDAMLSLTERFAESGESTRERLDRVERLLERSLERKK